MSSNLISSLMELQEKLHFGLGRDRKKVAIGVHDFDQIKPPFVYKAVNPKSIRFVPLAETREMNLEEILQRHPKGIAYAHLLSGKKKYPILIDAKKNVLSFPPIINGTLTEVTPFTTNIFIDVTGTDQHLIKTTLNIITTALAERGGDIYITEVKDSEDEYHYPDFSPREEELSVKYVFSILGTKLTKREIKESLERMGYDVLDSKNDVMKVAISPCRSDILHEVDIVEDVAIGYGFNRFSPDIPKSITYGKPLESYRVYDNARMIMIGLGFNEVTTLSLSNKRDEFLNIGYKEERDSIEIENPIGEEYNTIRVSLLPSLLKIGMENRHHSLPQQIFELGNVVENIKNKTHIAAIKIDSKANFTECKSIVEAFFRDIGFDISIEKGNHPAFISGRCASINYKDKGIGFFGELHPDTLTSFNIEHPAIAFEIDIEEMVQ